MKQIEFSIPLADGSQLFATQFTPDGDLKAIVCMVHGFGEHLGRYAPLAEAIGSAGYATIAYDQRGHGKSPGPRGYTPSYDHSQSDLGQVIKTCHNRFPDLPVILFAHSTGANLALYHMLFFEPDVTAGVISSPWLQLYDEPNMITNTALSVAGTLLPRFAVDLGDYEGGTLSRDPAIDDHYAEDPYTHGRMSYKLWYGVRRASKFIQSNIEELDIPILLQHGTGDTLIAFEGSERLAEAADPEMVTFKVWPDYWHILHDDLGKEAVIEHMLGWLDGQLPKKKR